MNDLIARIKIGLGIALMATLMGCIGYVDDGGGAVVVPGPEVTIFGGEFERGHDVHYYSHRGEESRGFDHHGGGEHGGGERGGRR